MKNKTNQPIREIKCGRVLLTLWENEGADGSYQTFQVSRLYRDPENAWRNTSSLNMQDAPSLLVAVQKLASELAEQRSRSDEQQE